MDRPRLRGLRIAWSVVCGILCVLLVVLWVRSYWWEDLLHLRITKTHILTGISGYGQLELSGWNTKPKRAEKIAPQIVTGRTFEDGRDEKWYSLGATNNGFYMASPYWCPVLLTAALTAIPWFPWSKRFGLRSFLVGTTLVAVLLGLLFSLVV
jgi:hypothetical protein